MRGRAVLEVDAGERRRELAQISPRRADQAGELAKLQWVGTSQPGSIS